MCSTRAAPNSGPVILLPLQKAAVSFIDASVLQETKIHYLATKVGREKGNKGFFPCGFPMRESTEAEEGQRWVSVLGQQMMNYNPTIADGGISPSGTTLCDCFLRTDDRPL